MIIGIARDAIRDGQYTVPIADAVDSDLLTRPHVFVILLGEAECDHNFRQLHGAEMLFQSFEAGQQTSFRCRCKWHFFLVPSFKILLPLSPTLHRPDRSATRFLRVSRPLMDLRTANKPSWTGADSASGNLAAASVSCIVVVDPPLLEGDLQYLDPFIENFRIEKLR